VSLIIKKYSQFILFYTKYISIILRLTIYLNFKMCKHVSIALLLFSIRFGRLYIYEMGKDIIEYEKNILNICHTIIMLPNKTDFYCLKLLFFTSTATELP